MVDIHIKDEGEFVTVCFQTLDAIKALKTQSIEVIESTYGSINYKKLDVLIESIPMIRRFALSHNLTFQSEI